MNIFNSVVSVTMTMKTYSILVENFGLWPDTSKTDNALLQYPAGDVVFSAYRQMLACLLSNT